MANSKRKLPTKSSASTAQEKPHTTRQIPNPDAVPAQGSPLGNLFKECLGYETSNFSSLTNFTAWLQRPVDGAALGVFRLLFGAAMLVDIAEERGGGQLDVRFGEPQHCHFPLFPGMRALAYPLMGCVYLCMWLGAWGIMLGYRFRCSCLAFIVPYWYILLLDKPTWNNHSYLFGLVGTLLLFTQADSYCSLESWLNPARSRCRTVPYWNYFLIKFQFFVLYMYAGLKKISAEWLSGYAMSSLSQHWVFAPFRQMLDPELIDLLIVHWFTAFFDVSIAFFMTIEKTRLLVTPFMLSFHLMNSRLFVIGMFPWVCLAEVPLFYGFDWPRRIRGRTKTSPVVEPAPTPSKPSLLARLRTCLILGYCVLQLFLPYSHFITKGYNNWTNGLYGYSWDMMVHSYDTLQTSIQIVDNDNQQEQQQPEQEPVPAKPLKSCLHVREYKIGDLVLYAERYRKTQVRWKRGRVLERITSISYKLEIEGKEVAAHVSYIKKYTGRKVRFGNKEYLEIDYEQVAEEERRAASYSIWNMV
ncbi:vitamin K-dependent gamma-carboxylase isoform X3 [Drosophila subobscura]|uniref:vitamin K-dependent gamma-carboxylase isoform X3 n=1 Tax=Drosophila subobscura TaxID=7241 RepID=UPI00155ADA22|nr:vitamin K-dependent gamma-carboxylase isoform X3 [Drosophila subobscura]